jgi:hypothetical protein
MQSGARSTREDNTFSVLHMPHFKERLLENNSQLGCYGTIYPLLRRYGMGSQGIIQGGPNLIPDSSSEADSNHKQRQMSLSTALLQKYVTQCGEECFVCW